MKTFKFLIAAAVLITALSAAPALWAAGGQQPQNQSQQNVPQNVPLINVGTLSNCAITGIETVGTGSYMCGIDANTMKDVLFHELSSVSRNILVEATCGSQDLKVLLEADDSTSFNWKLFYSQVLAAQLSGKKVNFGGVKSCGQGGKVADTIKLVSE